MNLLEAMSLMANRNLEISRSDTVVSARKTSRGCEITIGVSDAVFDKYSVGNYSFLLFGINTSQYFQLTHKYTPEEYIKISQSMLKYGGSFIKALSQTIWNADEANLLKLEVVFSEEFDRYLKM